MTIVLLGFFLLLALAASGFCSGAETGFLSVSHGRILHMARQGGKNAKTVLAAIADLPKTTTVLLVGNNLANVVYSATSAALSDRLVPGSAAGKVVWAAVAALVVLYFGEFLPKLFCAARPIRRTLRLAPCWKVVSAVLSPAAACVVFVVRRIAPRKAHPTRVTPEEVLKILEDRKDGVRLSDTESALIARIMVLRSRGREVTPERLLSVLK